MSSNRRWVSGRASHASALNGIASCRADYEKVANAVQSSLGDLQAPPEFDASEIGYVARQSEVKIGDGSALLIQHVDNTKPESEWPFELSAVLHEGDTTINRVYHLDRGFEALEAKLSRCGAVVERISG